MPSLVRIHLIFFALSIYFFIHVLAKSTCSLNFEGRIPKNATAALFTSTQSPYNPKYVLGRNVSWDQVIMFPDVEPALFDNPMRSKAIEVTINDKSIFTSSSEGAETALRRAELLINNKPATVSGKVTWHISLRTSPGKPLNLSHEYVLAFHEAQDFQADFWSLKAGKPMVGDLGPGTVNGEDEGRVLYIQGYKWSNPVRTFFKTEFVEDIWHNFGLYLDYDDNQMQVLYSTGQNRLEAVTPMVANNLSGIAPTTLGETHIGIQKKPVGANSTNYLYEGYQPFRINEGLVLGGIWQALGKSDGENCD